MSHKKPSSLELLISRVDIKILSKVIWFIIMEMVRVETLMLIEAAGGYFYNISQ